jgi:phage anti-repressor protein
MENERHPNEVTEYQTRTRTRPKTYREIHIMLGRKYSQYSDWMRNRMKDTLKNYWRQINNRDLEGDQMKQMKTVFKTHTGRKINSME